MQTGVAELVSRSLNIPPDYCCQGPIQNSVECFVSTQWIRCVIKDGLYSYPPLHDIWSHPEIQSAVQLREKIGDLWQRILVQVIPKSDKAVYPLARRSEHSPGLTADVSYSQLLHYVATSNNKNLWKDAYKKFPEHGVAVQWKGGAHVGTDEFQNVLRDVLWRFYGCKIIPLKEISPNHTRLQNSRVPGPHSNILPALCAFEGEHHFFVVLNSVHHNVQHCVSFSPAKLSESAARPLFILYQILEAVRDTHDRGLHLGDVTLNHLFVDNALYLSLLPSVPDNLLYPESLLSGDKLGKSNAFQKWDGARTIPPKQINSSKLLQVSDNSKNTADCDSEHSDSYDHSLEKNYLSQNQRSSFASSDSTGNTSKKSSCEDQGHSNGGCGNQLDNRLDAFQRLITSEDAFEILKQVSSKLSVFC
ncbi:hypothetical protein SK128_005347 [Halocaridina rubra]|uniref:Uncharacterized protein n=1 Tax=Halocaridina rubra TaxID=373956 RepID=A0AAN9A4B2_HALRR